MRRWSVWTTVHHQFFDFLALVGLRDRLRCPRCKTIGTWKPHGGWCDKFHDWRTDFCSSLNIFAVYATNRRWLCKYCGYNVSTDGEHQCYPNRKTKMWARRDENSAPTPQEVINLGYEFAVWPWRG